MDFRGFIFFILFSVTLAESKERHPLATLELWDTQRLVCGFGVEELPRHWITEKDKLKNRTINETDPTDEIVSTYKDFRCCLKKTWMHEDVVRPFNNLTCMKRMMKCLVESKKSPCVLTTNYYISYALSNHYVIFGIYFTMYMLVATLFALSSLSKHVDTNDRFVNNMNPLYNPDDSDSD
ncbi:uncharacterized protein LOC123670763 [Harmonia axyridis]|uniref:uncharacterized protein LOC123670763 n=1 Tax=Harmonia axyridis TaxID=115357 RepID=UPI001E2799D0|nr:uncharacterized protein LOC123670763 [Harmonia axyridis]